MVKANWRSANADFGYFIDIQTRMVNVWLKTRKGFY